ncbi:MAG: hypothetical protein ACYTKD_20090 [Planctomycetota bacterium]
MPIRFQCTFCLNKLSASEDFAGRRIACPMCETALEVPEPGEAPPFLVEDLADALERYKIMDFDRACAKRALELGLVPTRKLGSAIAKLREEMMRGRSPSLLRILRKYNRIDERGERKIRAGVDVPEPSRGSSGSPSRPKREHRDSLRILKQTVVLDVEAHELAKGPVPAVPGPALNRCPNCGRTVKGGAAREGKCPACWADVRAVVAPPPSGRSLRSAVAWSARNWLALTGIAAAIALAWAGLNWRRVRRMGAGLLKGESLAALEERVRRFDRALEFGDTEALGDMLAPDCGRATPGLRAFILSGAEPPPPIEKVLAIEHPEIDLDERAGRATVYTRVRAKLDLTRVKTREVESSADVAAAGRVMIGAAGGLSAELAWKWVRVDGRWFYRGPLPAARE